MNDNEKFEMITIVHELLIYFEDENQKIRDHFGSQKIPSERYAKIERLKEILES